MPVPFESPKFLLGLTRENVAEFEVICNGLFRDAGNTHVVDIDPQSGNKTFKIKFAKPIPPRARHIAATALSDIRHALDQALCDSVALITEKPAGLIYFPFATNPKDLDGRLRKSVPKVLHPVLRGFEPYPTGDGHAGGNTALATLSTAAGPNKHQAACSVGGQIVSFNVGSLMVEKAVKPWGLPPVWDHTTNEMILATVAPDGDVKAKLDITFYVAFKDAGKLSGAPVSAVLRNLLGISDRIVSGLEAETARIKRAAT